MEEVNPDNEPLQDEDEVFGPIRSLSSLGPLEHDAAGGSSSSQGQSRPTHRMILDEMNEQPGPDDPEVKEPKPRRYIPRINDELLTDQPIQTIWGKDSENVDERGKPRTIKVKRGLRVIPEIFQDVKFKGKGHEKEDLKILLRKYEYWAHQMYPKGCFRDVVDRVEELMTKKRNLRNFARKIKENEPLSDEEQGKTWEFDYASAGDNLQSEPQTGNINNFDDLQNDMNPNSTELDVDMAILDGL